jgi:hypothetical protein
MPVLVELVEPAAAAATAVTGLPVPTPFYPGSLAGTAVTAARVAAVGPVDAAVTPAPFVASAK